MHETFGSVLALLVWPMIDHSNNHILIHQIKIHLNENNVPS